MAVTGAQIKHWIKPFGLLNFKTPGKVKGGRFAQWSYNHPLKFYAYTLGLPYAAGRTGIYAWNTYNDSRMADYAKRIQLPDMQEHWKKLGLSQSEIQARTDRWNQTHNSKGEPKPGAASTSDESGVISWIKNNPWLAGILALSAGGLLGAGIYAATSKNDQDQQEQEDQKSYKYKYGRR